MIALQPICDGDGSVPSYDAVIHDGDFGFMTYNQFCTRYLNRKLSFDAVKLIATPWPPEEDGERLRGIIEQLAERVRNQRIARQQASVPVKVKKTEFTIPEETDYESLLSAEYTDGGDEQ